MSDQSMSEHPAPTGRPVFRARSRRELGPWVLSAVALVCAVVALVVALTGRGGGTAVEISKPGPGKASTTARTPDEAAVQRFCVNEMRERIPSAEPGTVKFKDLEVKPGTGVVVLVTTGQVSWKLVTKETIVESFRCESTQIPGGEGLLTQLVGGKLLSRG